MSMIQGCLFDPEAMKNAVISPAAAREFKKNAMPICIQDKAEGMQVRGFQHLDGRILLTQVGPIPRKYCDRHCRNEAKKQRRREKMESVNK